MIYRGVFETDQDEPSSQTLKTKKLSASLCTRSPLPCPQILPFLNPSLEEASEGSFSDVSRRIFASKCSFCNIFEIYNGCTLLHFSPEIFNIVFSKNVDDIVLNFLCFIRIRRFFILKLLTLKNRNFTKCLELLYQLEVKFCTPSGIYPNKLAALPGLGV